MGKSWYNHGGGVNYLCLSLDPEFPDNVQGGIQSGSYVYGVEYQKNTGSSLLMSTTKTPPALCVKFKVAVDC